MRLLRHHRPLQRRHRSVGAEHLHRLIGKFDVEFAGGDQAGPALLVNKILDDGEIAHVLAGEIVGNAARDQTSLAIDHIGQKAALRNLTQAVNEKLLINDHADHAQETALQRNRLADQHHCLALFSGAELHGRAVVGAAFGGGGKRVLQLAADKIVIKSDAAGGYALGFSVDQGGVGHAVGRRNEFFQQCTQLGRFEMIARKICATGHLHRRRQVRHHGQQGLLPLSQILPQRTSDGVLQQLFVGLKAVTFVIHHRQAVPHQRSHAYDDEHREDEIKDGNPRGGGKLQHGLMFDAFYPENWAVW